MKTALIASASALVLAFGFAGSAFAEDHMMSKDDMMAKYTVNGQAMTEEGYAQVQQRCDELIAQTSDASLASSSNDSAESSDMSSNDAMAQAMTDINLDTITAADCTNYGFSNKAPE